MDISQTSLYLTFSVFLIFLRLLGHGFKDLISYCLIFYFFFSFGAVINHLLGYPIYFGTPIEYIPQASLNFLISILAMVSFSFLIKRPSNPHIQKATETPIFVLILQVIFSLYAFSQGLIILIRLDQSSKIDIIQFLNPTLHYSYLMIQFYLVSFFFFMKTKNNKKIYWLNFISYVFYCLITGERDFIFPLMSISLHIAIFTAISRKKLVALILGLFSMIILGTAIFILRDSSQTYDSKLGLILNQGSLLFINSYTIKLMNESYEFFSGFTYLNSLLNLLPSWIYHTDFNSLAWFKSNYAPASNSGYGFGLDAEGYMNFGYLGTFITFALITIFQRLVIRNINTHDFFKFYTIFFHCFVLYSFRNDSLALLKGNLYAFLFYFLITNISHIPNLKKEVL